MSDPKTTECAQHGMQGMALACIHVARAIDSGAKVGFFCDESSDLARPDAWCRACNDLLTANGWSEDWFRQADFKILCAACWDLAQESLAGRPADRTGHERP
jgi:hypothetical protein